jgi:hypothetical protein
MGIAFTIGALQVNDGYVRRQRLHGMQPYSLT